MPLVSVIVPAYNTAPYIAETLDSIRAQTFRDYEVIVINDGSPDTPALERAVAPYRSWITYLGDEPHRGPAAARNRAIAAAGGRYIALLDSDDLWTPDYLAVHAGWLEQDPTIDVLSPNAKMFGNHPRAGTTFVEMFRPERPVTLVGLLSYRCHVYGGSTIRRRALDEVGGFDESLRTTEDYDLWVRLLAAGRRIVAHDHVLAHWRRRSDSLSSDSGELARHALVVLDKMAGHQLSADERQALQASRQEFRAQLALAESKRALLAGDYATALVQLTEANQFYQRRKLAVARQLVRFAPRLLHRAWRLRDRVWLGQAVEPRI